MSKRTFLSLFLSLVFSCGAFYFTFRNVPLSTILQYFRAINPFSAVVAMALVVMSLVIKGFRWKLIISPYRHLAFSQAYHPLVIGLMANCFLPARIGELVRPFWHKARNNTSFSACVASLAAERFFDLITLLTLLAATFWLVDVDRGVPTLYNDIELSITLLRKLMFSVLAFCLVIFLSIVLLSTSTIAEIFKRIILKCPVLVEKRSQKLHAFLHNKVCFPLTQIIDRIVEGFSIVRSIGDTVTCIGLSFGAWLLWAAGYMVLSQGSPTINLNFFEATASMVIICLFIALPSVPGYWGLWEAGGVFSLSLFGYLPEETAGLTLANHAVQMFPVCLAGLISVWLTGFRLASLQKENPVLQTTKAKSVS